jgi:hypothetical protein
MATAVKTKTAKAVAKAGRTREKQSVPAPVKPVRPSKFETAAKKVLAWANENYESKKYAWHRLVETTTEAEIVAELTARDLWGEKAVSHYRGIVKLWAEQEAETRA